MQSLLAATESIGRNCELGLIQRAYKVEPGPQLLRWCLCPSLPRLAEAMATGFSAMGSREISANPLAGHLAKQHWWLIDHATGLEPHTPSPRDVPLEDAIAKARTRWAKLRGDLLERLQRGEKLFVYASRAMRHPDELQTLLAAMRRHGSPWLLAVMQGKPGAALVGDNIILGRVPYLTNPRAAAAWRVDGWEAMLTDAHRIWRNASRGAPEAVLREAREEVCRTLSVAASSDFGQKQKSPLFAT